MSDNKKHLLNEGLQGASQLKAVQKISPKELHNGLDGAERLMSKPKQDPQPIPKKEK